MPLDLRDEPFDSPAATALMASYVQVIASHYPGWTPETGPTATAADFAPPSGGFVVASEGGRPVGCGGVKSLDGRHAEVKRLYVAPEARGRGVARAILSRLEEVAAATGHAIVRLDTGDRLPGALALFRSAGYREIDDYNGNPVASYWLEKPLTRPPGDPASGR